MARLLLTAVTGIVACQQVWAKGHLDCDADEMDLCDADDDGHGHEHGSTGTCDDPELDLCDYEDGGKASSSAFQLHMFEGHGCAKAADDVPSMSIEMNKCTTFDDGERNVKMTEKDADTIYMMLGATGCSDGEDVWGSGHALDCKKDGSECCDASMDGEEFSYKVTGPPKPTPVPTPVPMPTPVAAPTPSASPTPAPQGTPTPSASPTPAPQGTPTPSASPTPAPQGTEAADSANGQASAVLLASALAGVGTLLLDAA